MLMTLFDLTKVIYCNEGFNLCESYNPNNNLFSWAKTSSLVNCNFHLFSGLQKVQILRMSITKALGIDSTALIKNFQ
jgi:hypothetical protein